MERVQAYFRNENEAEDVKAKLQTIDVREVMVERVPESNKNLWDLIRDTFSTNSHSFDQENHNPHVVEFKVSEGDYPEAKSIVEANKGYIQ